MSAIRIILLALVVIGLGGAPSAAQTYPTKPIRIIVPTSPGGITDTLARAGDPAFREKFLDPAVTFSIATPPEQFAARIRADLARWGKVIKDANIKVE